MESQSTILIGGIRAPAGRDLSYQRADQSGTGLYSSHRRVTEDVVKHRHALDTSSARPNHLKRTWTQTCRVCLQCSARCVLGCAGRPRYCKTLV
eukprot:1781068-Pyramimonas_sp.AAC.2